MDSTPPQQHNARPLHVPGLTALLFFLFAIGVCTIGGSVDLRARSRRIPGNHRVSAHSQDFTDQEAIATIFRIARGNMRLLERLMMQLEHILLANKFAVVTKELLRQLARISSLGSIDRESQTTRSSDKFELSQNRWISKTVPLSQDLRRIKTLTFTSNHS